MSNVKLQHVHDLQQHTLPAFWQCVWTPEGLKYPGFMRILCRTSMTSLITARPWHIHYCWPILTHDILISPVGISKGCELMSWTSLIHEGCIDGNSNRLTLNAADLVQTFRASFFMQSLIFGTWEVRKCCCWSQRNCSLYLVVLAAIWLSCKTLAPADDK